jgi:hypothetical protein
MMADQAEAMDNLLETRNHVAKVVMRYKGRPRPCDSAGTVRRSRHLFFCSAIAASSKLPTG